MFVRTTLELDEEILRRLRRFVPQRGLSRFLNQTIAEKVVAFEQREREEGLRQSMFDPSESEQLALTLYAVDPEGWSE